MITKEKFFEILNSFKNDELESKFLVDYWRDINKNIESRWKENFPKKFLEDPFIEETMYVGNPYYGNLELKFVKQNINYDKLHALIMKEPAELGSKYIFNSIHHLYHLKRYENETKVNLENLDVFVEWGGGYGNMARLVKDLYNKTYVIVDTPFFSTIQYYFLSYFYDESELHICENQQDVKQNKINILPVTKLSENKLKSDIFISTWALSESNAHSQKIARDFLIDDNTRLLLAFQSNSEMFNHAESVININQKSKISDIDHISYKSKYLFY